MSPLSLIFFIQNDFKYFIHLQTQEKRISYLRKPHEEPVRCHVVYQYDERSYYIYGSLTWTDDDGDLVSGLYCYDVSVQPVLEVD